MNASNDPASAFPAAGVASTSGPAPGAESRWPLWQRLGFRYLLCHALLYALPRPFSLLFGTLADGFAFLASKFDLPWLREGAATWPREAAVFLGRSETWWQTATQWLSGRGWTPVAVLVQPADGGDTAHDCVKLAIVMALALLLAVVWSVLATAPAHPRLGRWLHLFVRWNLAFWMLAHGAAKLYLGRDGTPELSQLTAAVGDQSPGDIASLLLAASRPWELLAGGAEVLGALLLFHRRTALLGCALATLVLAHLCAWNWLCDLPWKLHSTQLLLGALLLAAPYGARLWALFVGNRPSSPVDLAVVKRPWLAWLLALFGWGWVACHLVQSHVAFTKQAQQAEEQRGPQPELYGVWTLETMRIDGVDVPATDPRRWQFLAIDRGRRAWVRDATGAVTSFGYTEDLAAGRIGMTPAGDGPQTWTVEQGSRMVEVPDPSPRTAADRERRVGIARRTLRLQGALGGKALELHAIERVFAIPRGIHLVQEMPLPR